MTFGLCFGGWGIGNCGAEGKNTEVETTFTQSNETVMEFLQEVALEFEANQETNHTSGNDTILGDIETNGIVAGDNADIQIGHTTKQDATSESVSQITSLIEIINSMQAKNDTKLDALATVANSVNSSSVLASAGSVSKTNVTNKTNVKSKSVSKISNVLNQLAFVQTTNKLTAGNIKVAGDILASENAKVYIGHKIEQQVKAYTGMLIDLVNNSESTTYMENGAELKAEIEQMLKAQQQSILDGMSKLVENTLQGASGIFSTFSKPFLYVVIGIVAIIILFILIKAFSGNKQQVVYMQGEMSGGTLEKIRRFFRLNKIFK